MNQNTVIIKAISRKGKIYENALVKATDPEDAERSVTLGNYKGNRLPRVIYGHRPHWRDSLKRFPCSMEEEDFQKWVPKCHLVNDKTGEIIKEANFFNPRDPFLTHSKFMITDTEGRVDLDLDIPIEKLLIACLESSPLYHRADSGKPVMSSMVKYEIIRPEALDKRKSIDLDKKEACYEYLRNMDESKKVKIGIVLKLRISDKTEAKTVRDELLRAFEDNYDINGKNVQDSFLYLSSLSASDFEVEFMMANALKKGYLTRSAEGFLLFGNPIAKNTGGVLKYLKDPDNFETIERLQKSFKLKD